MKELFCVGDRVVVVCSNGGATRAHIGRVGTVVHVPNGFDVGVEFDDAIYMGTTRIGHDCNGHCKRGFGRYCMPSELEFLQPEATCSVEDLL